MSNPGVFQATSFKDQSIIIDDSSSTISYFCFANAGSSSASALWKVFRIDTSTSPLTVIKFADGNANYDNIAANRATLTYT